MNKEHIIKTIEEEMPCLVNAPGAFGESRDYAETIYNKLEEKNLLRVTEVEEYPALTYKIIKDILNKGNAIDYFKRPNSKNVLYYIGFEQSGKMVIQDENYSLHLVKDEKDIEDWTIGTFKWRETKQ